MASPLQFKERGPALKDQNENLATQGDVMKEMPNIQKFMTNSPHTINQAVPLKVAAGMMKEHHIRHLPVQEGGTLVGVLTDRDVKLASSFSEADSLTVADVMTSDPFTVEPEASLDSVAEQMARHRYGCAVVRQANGKVVGIFTAVDGLRALAEVLRQGLPPESRQ